MPDYLALEIPCVPECSDALASFAFDQGALGVEEKEGRLIAFFAGGRSGLLTAIRRYLEELAQLGYPMQPGEVICREVADRDWNAEWKKSYTGFEISSKIYIKPTWEVQPASAYSCQIEIDPEMAFGTGTHATTRLCLHFIEERIRPGDLVLDIGTGTGILAIAAAKLGAAVIVAFDIDPIAAETASRNATVNGVRDKLEIFAGQLSDLKPRPFDLILANIQRNEIVAMLPQLRALSSAKAYYVFSGILCEEEGALRAALTAAQFEILEMRFEEEWLACLAQ